MEKVIKVKNLDELKEHGIKFIPPYPKEKLKEECRILVDKLFNADVEMKLVCMKHINSEKSCIECPLYTYDRHCIFAGIRNLVCGSQYLEEEYDKREEAWADAHGLTGNE